MPSALVGALLVDMIRYSGASAIMLALGFILGFRPEGGFIGVLGAVGMILIFCFCLSWVWTTLGIIMRSEKSLMMVSFMFLFPLTFVSNVFVDPETLPSWLESFVDVNPISLLVDAVRGFMHGNVTGEAIAWVLLASAIFLVVFAPLTMYLYRNKK